MMDFLLAHCSAVLVHNGNIFASVLVAGFLGSLTHCAAMCGPMLVAQRLSLATPSPSLLWYHAGRITTYMVLGALAAFSSRVVFGDYFHEISGLMLVAAGLLFLASAAKPKATHACGCGGTFARLLTYRLPQTIRLALRGLLLGFIPCGLTLAALLLVATLPQPATAALAMGLFGLGTLPVLQLIGYGAGRAGNKMKSSLSFIGRGALTLNGLVLCALGMHMI
ncbi:MAG: sulfite exporter TauE/SafE family protein [Alphaproteobacteria bacterium]